MAWDVNMLYQLMLKLVKKNQAGSISSTDLFFHWNAEQNMYHSDVVGRWQARANGKQGANTGLIQNETIIGELAIFTIPTTLTITAAKATKPDDFIYRMAARINGKKVTFINPDQKATVNDSVIDPPSTTDNCYYGIEYEDYYSLLPTTLPTVSITTMELDYVASCNDVKWGYTWDANNRQVYNPGTSVQPKWSTPVIIEITKRTLATLGVAFKDSDFTQSGRKTQDTGN